MAGRLECSRHGRQFDEPTCRARHHMIDQDKQARDTARASESSSPAGLLNDDESRWQALVRRDRLADGVFYYNGPLNG